MTKEKLRKVAIFKELTDEEIDKIIAISTIKKLAKDNILFYEGEEPKYFYALIDGFVKFYKTDQKGHEIVIHYFTKPTFVAEMPTFENIPFPATAISMRDESEFLLIERNSFLNLLHTDTRFSYYIIKSLTHKVRTLEQVINRNLIYDAITKVCSFIKEHPQAVADTKHKEIAIILNMAPETLSRTLKKLKTLQIIDAKCKLQSMEKLDMFLEL